MKQCHPLRYGQLRLHLRSQELAIRDALNYVGQREGYLGEAITAEANRLYSDDIMSPIEWDALFERRATMDQVHKAWCDEGQTVYDLDTLEGDDAFDADDANLMDFTMPAQNFYVHFGKRAGYCLEARPNLFLDGAYVRSVLIDGQQGIRFTFVCDKTEARPMKDLGYAETLLSMGQMTTGWVGFDAPISNSLRQQGLFGDPLMLDDQMMPFVVDEMNDIIARICFAERTVVLKNPGMRH